MNHIVKFNSALFVYPKNLINQGSVFMQNALFCVIWGFLLIITRRNEIYGDEGRIEDLWDILH
jgi:hypothetical protein